MNIPKSHCQLRTLMLNVRIIEEKTSYLRYSKNVLIHEFHTVILEYQEFISTYRSLYTKTEKEYIQKYRQYCKDFVIGRTQKGSFQKMVFQFFCHIIQQYRYFQKNIR